MNSLQILVQSIVTDLITARFEADIKAAELAEVYKDNAILKGMAIPTLNISNVSVDLRVAFDSEPISATNKASEAQTKAITAATAKLNTKLASMKSVAAKIKVPRQKTTFSKNITANVVDSASKSLFVTPQERKQAVEERINTVLTANKVKLTAAEQKSLTAEIAAFESIVAAAPKAPPKVPGVIVGAEALEKLTPDSITSIKFDIDLGESRWTETKDIKSASSSVLTKG